MRRRRNWSTYNRLSLPFYSARLISVGQFRSAGGLVLLSGGALGPRMFLPLARGHKHQGRFCLKRRYSTSGRQRANRAAPCQALDSDLDRTLVTLEVSAKPSGPGQPAGEPLVGQMDR